MNAATNDKTIFHVKKRETIGKKVSQLRGDGLLPGNIYGLSKDSQPISANAIAFTKLYEAEGDTGLIYLSIDEQKKQVPVLIDEVEYHPVTGEIQHAVFRRVDLTEKITTEVPIELVGENEVPGAAVITVRDSLEVSALPAELPENFAVDISNLKEFGDAITIEDLAIDTSKVEIIMTGDMEPDSPLVLLQEIKEEPEEDEEPTSVEDVELVGEGAEAEGKASEDAAQETPSAEDAE